ncbi:MAG: 3-oxoacyl-[acyl-carrier-protein] reductase [Chloroflexi bacterium]|nr:3-oxoacyl-[acyl-carrier-protein] reductase [Chloroflexota bacterium]
MKDKLQKEKIALVTGASKGIGKAISLKLAKMGIKVAINYNSSKNEAKKTADSIIANGGDSIILKADVSNYDEVQNIIKEIETNWGPIDILVNNAGIISDNLLVRMSIEEWTKVINTNLNGTFYSTRSVLRNMLKSRWGRIINIGSVVGLRGNIGQTNYAASKAAIIGFTKALAKEVAARNITVNTVTPGYINTETVDILPQKLKDHILTHIPQQQFGEIEDIAHIVGFLASEEANYITGQTISVDGGLAI